MKDAIIVLSGGMDSTSMLHDYKDRIALAVTFDYGSNHNEQEIKCAKSNCELLGIEHIVIPLKFIGEYFESSLLSGADEIPAGEYDESNMRSTVVPFRNGIMLSVACGLAECRGLKYVMIANHSGDHSIYPDCRPGFVDAMSKAMQEGTYDNIEIYAPYTMLKKGEILKRGVEAGLNPASTYSCYKGREKHCGECGTCRERKEAFQEAGITDDTIYEV